MTKREFINQIDSYGIQAKEGYCPCCHSARIELIDTDFGDGEIYFNYYCQECGMYHSTHYALSYIEHCSFCE